jgi:hypothetical protein
MDLLAKTQIIAASYALPSSTRRMESLKKIVRCESLKGGKETYSVPYFASTAGSNSERTNTSRAVNNQNSTAKKRYTMIICSVNT